MRLTKTQLKKDTAKMWNNTRVVHGINIARVCWFEEKQYMIIEDNETFTDASNREFTPILYFRTQAELVDQLYTSLNK